MLIRGRAALAALVVAAVIPVGGAGPAYAADEFECKTLADDAQPATTEVPSLPVDLLHIEQAHDMFAAAGRKPGEDVKVAVVDSGVADTGHLNVQPLPTAFPNVFPIDYHGTAVAGLIGAEKGTSGIIGIAPAATIVDVRVYETDDPSKDGIGLQPANVVDGLRRLLVAVKSDPTIKVVNISLAMDHSTELEKVVRKLIKRDVVVVAASGNRPTEEGEFAYGKFSDDPPTDSEAGEDAASVFFPAGYDDVLTVNASGEGFGLNPIASVLQNSQTDVAAPTANAVTLDRQGGTCRLVETIATSWATAEVSGVVAMLRSWYPDESAAQIVARLKATASGIEPGSVDVPVSPMTGVGVIQPVEAMTRQMTVGSDGTVVAMTDAARQLPPARAPQPEADPLGSMRENAVWWGMLSGGAIVFALLMRPLIARLRR